MIKIQQFSFSGAEKPFCANLPINFISELFLMSIKTHIFMLIKLLVDHLEFI